jgi:ADP-L-glycero-D-manno-heptose 6-epimerase
MILVTGGAGFIGANLLAGLEAKGIGPLAVCDRLGDDGKWRNIAKRELADIVPPDGLAAWLGSHGAVLRAVFHLGATSSTTARDGDEIVANNFRFSRKLWRWAAEHDTTLIYASSAAVYGDGAAGFDDDPAADAMARLRPLNLYGWSKLLFDRWVARTVAMGEPSPPQWAGLRFFNVYGPNEYHKGAQQSVVPQLFEQIGTTGRATLFRSHHRDYPDGGQMRDFIHVDDCVDVMSWLLENRPVTGIFNVGTGNPRTFGDLAAAVFAALGQSTRIDYIDTPEDIRAQYQYFTKARMDRLRGAGYARPFLELEEGIRAYVQDFLDTPDRYR